MDCVIVSLQTVHSYLERFQTLRTVSYINVTINILRDGRLGRTRTYGTDKGTESTYFILFVLHPDPPNRYMVVTNPKSVGEGNRTPNFAVKGRRSNR